MNDIEIFYKHKFDFKQHKDNYDDWSKAFSKAVEKRKQGRVFIGLSSGYDSGALSWELLKQEADFKAYTMFSNENADIIKRRLECLPNHEIAEMDGPLWKEYYDYLDGKINPEAQADIASMGVAYTFETAVKQGRKINISGQGADEIISDYALYPGQSTFKGVWPEKLEEWENFRNGKQKEYLAELEEIAALYGVEVRYPFLDVDLVQEFLWLSPKLKNRCYKAPLEKYLTDNKVPFERDVKRGFRPYENINVS
jgi:asparagine synthetase B (glutamine-hydrolysing)